VSFANAFHKFISKADYGAGTLLGDPAYQLFKPKAPPAAPGVPNPNDAANQAQSLTDQMRMRRGLMANIYAGGNTGPASAPVTGKTALGT
jgi:hypothetical protein